MKPLLILLLGPKGSGKTHLGSVVEATFGVPFVRAEPIFLDFYREHPGAGVAAYEPYARVEEALRAAFADGGPISVESTGAGPAFAQFLDRLRALYRVLLVRVDAPEEICAQRVQQRDQRQQVPVSRSALPKINEAVRELRLPWDLELVNEPPLTEEAIVAAIGPLLDQSR